MTSHTYDDLTHKIVTSDFKLGGGLQKGVHTELERAFSGQVQVIKTFRSKLL